MKGRGLLWLAVAASHSIRSTWKEGLGDSPCQVRARVVLLLLLSFPSLSPPSKFDLRIEAEDLVQLSRSLSPPTFKLFSPHPSVRASLLSVNTPLPSPSPSPSLSLTFTAVLSLSSIHFHTPFHHSTPSLTQTQPRSSTRPSLLSYTKTIPPLTSRPSSSSNAGNRSPPDRTGKPSHPLLAPVIRNALADLFLSASPSFLSPLTRTLLRHLRNHDSNSVVTRCKSLPSTSSNHSLSPANPTRRASAQASIEALLFGQNRSPRR